MNAPAMGPYGLQGEGLGIFESVSSPFSEDPFMPGMHAAGTSRSSKVNKKKDDDEDSVYTTVMLRNIPNKYTRQMLIDQLHRAGFRGDIDYLYLPTDFANRCNVGYCFVNLRTSGARARFTVAFDGVAAQSCLPGFNSYKVCQVTRAKWQGREENVRRLRSGPELMAQLAAHPEWLPLLLDEEGNQEPFICDEGLSAARGPAPPRRQMRKKNAPGAGGVAAFGGGADGWPGFPDMTESMARGGAIAMGTGRGMGKGGAGAGMPMGMSMGMGIGMPAGGDRGGRRRRGGRGQQAGMVPGGVAFSEYTAAAHAAYAGVPMMPVPVMTEQGLQYMPYDAYEGGYFLAYPAMGDQQVYGMPYAAPYGAGFPGWWGGEGAGGGYEQYGAAAGVWPRKQGIRRRGRAGSGSALEPVEQDGQEDELDDE